jgi:hypothetical protein
MRQFLSAIAAVALFLANQSAAVAHPGPWHWSLERAMERIDGKRVHVGPRIVRIDSAAGLCSGVGRAVRQQGIRAWKHFDCTYSVFVAGHGLYDYEFRVHVLGLRKFLITNAHWITEPPPAQ